MSDKNNTPPPPEGELKFQMQAMTKMMERISFVMGNVCDKFEKVEKCGNEVGTSTQNMRKVGVESKSNNGSRTERPRWADYEDFEDEAIGKVFDSLKTEETSGIELQANSIRWDISVTLGDMMM